MANGTRTKTGKNELESLREEVTLLRSVIISILGEDREGKYRPNFVRTILKASKEKPNREFTDAKSFLQELKKA